MITITEQRPWRPNGAKIPVINITGRQQPMRTSDLGSVLVEFSHHEEDAHVIIDVPFLTSVRKQMGRIAAIKYVRTTSISLLFPNGMSLRDAKDLCDALFPEAEFAEIDKQRADAPPPFDLDDLRQQLTEERDYSWNLKEKLYRYEERFGPLPEPKKTDYGPRADDDDF